VDPVFCSTYSQRNRLLLQPALWKRLHRPGIMK
jgi:hypothetical protein